MDKDHYNLYCATKCDVRFPKGCDIVCGWPEMKQVSQCKVSLFCPCRDSRGKQDAEAKMAFVQEHAGDAYIEPTDMKK